MMKCISVVESAVYTDKGNIRGNNEDNFYLNGKFKSDAAAAHMELEEEHAIQGEEGYFTCAVCDGIGGIEAGEEASLSAAKKLLEYDGETLANHIEDYYLAANKEICCMMNGRREGRMGTTAVVLHIKGDAATVGNIGDSRAYLFRPETDELRQLTKDQTRAQQLVDAGVFTEEEMIGSRHSHILSQFLGVTEDEFIIEPDIKRDLSVKQGDIFLLCSDGLTDMIKEEELRQLLTRYQEEKAMTICKILGGEALNNGGLDNVTVAILKIRRQ